MIFTNAQWALFRRTSEEHSASEFETVKNNFMRGRVGKATRPWFVVDFTKILPTGATMFGFEIETGFGNETHQRNMMQWLWDNTDYVTADCEGCASVPTEITFPPLTLAELDGDNQLKHWLNYNNSIPSSQRAKTTVVSQSHPRGGVVGTHVNISTAAYRSADAGRRAEVAVEFSRFFRSLSPDQCLHLYGRQPYIEGVCQRRGGQGDAADRIEFKMFHTTTNIEQFDNYCKVAKRLAELMDSLVGNLHVLDNVQTFNYLTQDLDGQSVIVSSNGVQYPAEWRNGYQNQRDRQAA